MAIIAVGDFDSSEIETMIRERFSKHQNPMPSRNRRKFDVPESQSEQFIVASDPEETVTSVEILTTRYTVPEIRTVHEYRILSLTNSFIND